MAKNKVDILCIVPPFNYGNYADIGPKCPPLGIATIAAYLEENNYKVKIIDAFALDLNFDQIKQEIIKNKPGIVFTGSVSATHTSALKILEMAKEIDSSIKTVIGGPHPSNAPESCFPQADCVAIHESEETARELCNHFIGGKNKIKNIKGIAYKENRNIIRTEKRPFIKDLDTLPMPAYHLLPMDAYKSYGWLDTGRRFSSMVTSRGCPFRCSFCASSKNFEHWWRARSAEKVFGEIQLLYDKYDIKHIYFQDDEFCVNPFRVKEICKLIKESNMDLYWECLTRVVTVTDDMLKEMASAGCKSVLYGIEVGYEEGWKKIGKQITKELCIKAVRSAQKNGIIVKCTFILGFPWENKDEIKQTINFAKKLNPDIAFFPLLVPYVGSYIWEQYYKNDPSLIVGGGKNMEQYIMHGVDPNIKTEYLTAEELEYWVGRANLEFYLRPRYIFQRLKTIKNVHDLKRNINSGKTLLKLAIKRVLARRPNGESNALKSTEETQPNKIELAFDS